MKLNFVESQNGTAVCTEKHETLMYSVSPFSVNLILVGRGSETELAKVIPEFVTYLVSGEEIYPVIITTIGGNKCQFVSATGVAEVLPFEEGDLVFTTFDEAATYAATIKTINKMNEDIATLQEEIGDKQTLIENIKFIQATFIETAKHIGE